MDSFRVFSNGAGLVLLGGVAYAEQCHEMVGTKLEQAFGEAISKLNFPTSLHLSHSTPSTH